MDDGDIDPTLSTDYIRNKIRDEFIADATVVVVLIGAKTWQRKYVDWEIGSGIRDTRKNSRTGLLGILLPSYDNSGCYDYPVIRFSEDEFPYNYHTIPPRLYDNVECGFAKIYSWNNIQNLGIWIQEAFDRRFEVAPSNWRDSFKKNSDSNLPHW